MNPNLTEIAGFHEFPRSNWACPVRRKLVVDGEHLNEAGWAGKRTFRPKILSQT
jgi:hypothetical protein